MPTILTTLALEANTYKITAAFTDEDGSAVTPDSGLNWTLTDEFGNVLNSRTAVSLTPGESVSWALTGADLATTGVEDTGIRVVTIDGSYDSDLGDNLPLDQSVQFCIDTQLPVSLQDAKLHLNISGTDDDIYISQLITTARQYVENLTGRKLITQTVTKYFDSWHEFDLPYGNLQSVTSIKYTDSDGDQSTWSSGDYDVDTETLRGRVVLGYSKSFPSVTLTPVNPIEIIYICGYGATKAHVPYAISQAIKILVSHYYEYREPEVIGTIVAEVPMGVNALLESYKTLHFI